MKLLLCGECWDVFKLDYEMRKCKCGKVRGHYIDNLMAEVSENAISLAMGNGSIQMAVARMMGIYQNTDGAADRREYIEEASIIAWARPNDGPGNPHTTLLEAES